MGEHLKPTSEGDKRSEILERAREYLAKGNAEMETGSSLSMRHILNGALSPLNLLVQLVEKDPNNLRDVLKTQDSVADFSRVFEVVDSYFELLEKYPHFKVGEKAEGRGYFSDNGINVPVRVGSYREALERGL